MTDYEMLAAKANDGRITTEEVREVAARLQKCEPGEDLFTLLRILGEASLSIPSLLTERWYRDTIEGLAAHEQDPALTWQTLEIVCNYWGDAERCRILLHRFIDGAPWDSGEEIRVHAIMIAGSFLRSHQDTALLRRLIQIFENEKEPHGRREDAYLALGRAMGWSGHKMPSPARTFDLQKDIDPSLLAAVHQRLLSEEAS